MGTEAAPRKSYLNELKEESQTVDRAQNSNEIQKETLETKKEIEKLIQKVKITLGEINIKLISYGKTNHNLLKQINDWNNVHKNEKDASIITGNLIGILRNNLNDPNITPILDQLLFCMNTLTNQYNVKGEVDGITEAISSIGDTVKIMYKPEKGRDQSSLFQNRIHPSDGYGKYIG